MQPQFIKLAFTVNVTNGAQQVDTHLLDENALKSNSFNALEAVLDVDAPTGDGANPTLDVKLVSSLKAPEDFADVDDDTDLVTFTQLTTSAGVEKKGSRASATGPVNFGRKLWLHLTGDCDAGADKTYTGTIYLKLFHD